MSSKIAAALVVLLFGVAIAQEGLSRSHHFPGKQLVFDEDSFENTTLTYAICDLGKEQTDKKCTVVRETNVFQGTSKTVSCEVSLKAEKAQFAIGSNLMVVPLGINRTILVWTENDEKRANNELLVRYTTVKFPECNTTEARLSFVRKDKEDRLDLKPSSMQVVTYDDGSYDVAFLNGSLCGDKAICKIHVDTEAGNVTDPKKWFTPESGVIDVIPVVPHSPNKGHFIVEGMFVNVPQAYVVKTDGQIVKFPSELDSQRQWKLIYSMTYSTIGLCYYSNSSFNCAQYDHEGQPKVRSNPDFGFAVELAAMHNLRGGGFLLLTSRCDAICAMNDDHYYVTKFDAQGKKVGEVHLTGFHREALANIVKAQFFEKDDGQYCVSMVRYDISPAKESGDMLLFAKCFDDKNFK